MTRRLTKGDTESVTRDAIAALRAAYLMVEAQILRDALVASHWSLRAAAKQLGCARSTLQTVLKRHPELMAEFNAHVAASMTAKKTRPKREPSHTLMMAVP